MTKFQNFDQAFSTRTGSARSVCACGKEYYDNYNTGNGWGSGELEALQASSEAIPVEHSVGAVEFDGVEYVNVCGCWEDKAAKLMDWLDEYKSQIADYFNLERERLLSALDNIPKIR